MYTTGATYARGNNCQVTDGIELCKKYLPDLTPDDVILDIGCGTGEITHFLAKKSGAKVTGIDKIPELIQYAKLNNGGANINYEVVDAQVKAIYLKIIFSCKLIFYF